MSEEEATPRHLEDAKVTLAVAFEQAGFSHPDIQRPRNAQKRPGKRDKKGGRGTRAHHHNKEKANMAEGTQENNESGKNIEKKSDATVSFGQKAVEVSLDGAKIAGASIVAGTFVFFGMKLGEAVLGLFSKDEAVDAL